MRKSFATSLLLAAWLGSGGAAFAEAGLSPGARAGNAIVPSTHSPGCGGILCDADDPRRAVGAPPPPPCEGLICGLAPYGMGRPVTAAEAQRMQEERARAAAAAAVPPPAAPAKHRHRRIAKAAAKKTVAVRTPDTSAAPPAAR